MKTTILFLFISSLSFSQTKENYITYYNYASEAEYYFHEEMYDSAVYYFEKGFQYASEPQPQHTNKYSKALWRVNERAKAVSAICNRKSTLSIDTNWFLGLSDREYDSINQTLIITDSDSNHKRMCKRFMDSIMLLDQFVRVNFDFKDSVKLKKMIVQDSMNELAVIEFTKKYGFPGGKNIGWHQTVATFLLHVSPEWFVENYALLIQEVKKGNLEPSMLARGIDRMYAIDLGEDKINPFNRYWNQSKIDPFLMYLNCISLGVSPYYDYNWFNNPRKTIHFDYYKANKQYYNTTVIYE